MSNALPNLSVAAVECPQVVDSRVLRGLFPSLPVEQARQRLCDVVAQASQNMLKVLPCTPEDARRGVHLTLQTAFARQGHDPLPQNKCGVWASLCGTLFDSIISCRRQRREKAMEQVLSLAAAEAGIAPFEAVPGRLPGKLSAIVSCSREDAKDGAQTALTRACEIVSAGGTIDNPSRWWSWLLTTGRYAIIDAQRKRARVENRPDVVEQHGDTAAIDPATESERRELQMLVRKAIEELPAEICEIIQMRVYGGLTTEEIEKQTGRSFGAVRWCLEQARENLRDRLRNVAEE